MSEQQSEQAEKTLREMNINLANAMDELRRVEIPRIQEEDFLNNWLPLFSNLTDSEKETLDDETTRRPMMLWAQNVAKNPLSPVDVFSGDIFLFRVPPLFRDITFDFRDRHPTYDIAHELTIAEKKRTILPALGEAHFQDRVSAVIFPKFVLDETGAQMWNEIFSRYGMPTIELTPKAAPVQKEKASGELTADDVGDEPLDEL